MARATAAGIKNIASAIDEAGGEEAAAMKMGEKYIRQFERVAKKETSVVLPVDLGDLGGSLHKIQHFLRPGESGGKS